MSLAGKWGPRIESMYGSVIENGDVIPASDMLVYQGVSPNLDTEIPKNRCCGKQPRSTNKAGIFLKNFSGYLAPTHQSTRGATAKMSGLFFGVKLFVLTFYQLTIECKINVGQDTLKKALTKGRTTCGDETFFPKKMEANQPKQHPRHPVIFSADDWGVQSPPKRIGFRFHYHSQKVSQDP